MRRIAPIGALAFAMVAITATARTPEAGAGWRIAFVVLVLGSVPILLWAVRSLQPSTKQVVLVAALLRLIALPLAPTLSDDGYRYMWDGALVLEGISPYAETPREIVARGLDMPLALDAMNSPDYHSVYPPVSQIVFAAGMWAGRGDVERAWWFYKLLIVGLEVLGIWLLARALPVRETGIRTSAFRWPLALYAWHPLAVIEVAGQGHTEGVALALLSLGVAAHLRSRLWASGGWLAAAGWVKLWPFALAAIWARSGWPVVAGLTLVAIALAAPFAADLRGAVDSLGLYAGTFDFYSAPYLIIKSAVWPLLGESAGAWASGILAATFLSLIAVIALAPKLKERPAVHRMGEAVLAFVLCSATLHPWHLLPALWATQLVQNRHITRSVVWLFSCSAITYLGYVGFPWAPPLAVWVGWGGSAILATPLIMPLVLKRRGGAKWQRIKRLVADASGPMLDFGAAEGFVGAAAARDGIPTTLADIEDVRRVDLPFLKVEGSKVESPDSSFDIVVLVFVLHHAEHPEQVIAEARRLTSNTLVVWETTSRPWISARALTWLDNAANSLRPGGHYFPRAIIRDPSEWETLLASVGLTVIAREDWGVVHPQTIWRLEHEVATNLSPEAL